MGKKQPDPIDVKVGARIRMRRITLGISQEKLAEALGLTFQQVQKYEKGTNRIGASRVLRIATALKVPVSYFYEGIEQATATGPDPVQAMLMDRAGAALAAAFQRLPHDARAAVLTVVEQIAAAHEIPQPQSRAA